MFAINGSEYGSLKSKILKLRAIDFLTFMSATKGVWDHGKEILGQKPGMRFPLRSSQGNSSRSFTFEGMQAGLASAG